MKAFEIKNGFGLENLVCVDRPDPTPGLREVLVRMRACSVNYRDLLMVRGQYNPRQELPLIPLSDGAGEVVAVGPSVTRVKPGDHVVSCFMQGFVAPPLPRDGSHLKRTLGGPLDGVLAELVLLSEEGVVRVPESIPYVDAGTLPCAALTAWSALVTQGGLKAGDSVVVQGTGGVSLFALQIAKMFGARVIATSSSGEKLERAKALGADALVNYTEKPDWGKEVRAVVPEGVDHVIDIGGGGTLAQSLKAVCAGGTVSVIGMLSGHSGEVPLNQLFMRNVRLQGVFVGSRHELQEMVRAFAQHRVKPVVDKVFPFAESRAAIAAIGEAKHFGKIAIELGG